VDGFSALLQAPVKSASGYPELVFEVSRLHGVLVALATPIGRDGRVDEGAAERLVEHVIAGGVRGLLPLGSTGETASLDDASRRTMLAAAVTAARGRVPVICGVAQSHVASARAELEAASKTGAAAALVAPPFYYPTDQAGVLDFYRALADRSPLPLLLYNIPQFTKVVAEPATVATLAREGVIQGIKDSSRDFEYFEGVCIATRDLPAFRIFTGSDTMLVASLAMGGSGTICGAGNVAPSLVVRIYDEYVRGQLEAARADQDRLYQLVAALRVGVFPLGIKAALHMLGICEAWSAPPLRELDERFEAPMRRQLEVAGLLRD
jgi:4-hydroxy-tetrahydrodipicolinate synthase